MNPKQHRWNLQQERDRAAAKRRRSAWVAIGVAGALVVGAPVLYYALTDDEEEAEPVSAGRTYENNQYVPGAGYYHSGYHGFFPFRYNHYDPSRGGYYQGGSWGASPGVANVAPSMPNASAVAEANTRFRSTRSTSRGGFGKIGSFFSSSRS